MVSAKVYRRDTKGTYGQHQHLLWACMVPRLWALLAMVFLSESKPRDARVHCGSSQAEQHLQQWRAPACCSTRASKVVPNTHNPRAQHYEIMKRGKMEGVGRRVNLSNIWKITLMPDGSIQTSSRASGRQTQVDAVAE